MLLNVRKLRTWGLVTMTANGKRTLTSAHQHTYIHQHTYLSESLYILPPAVLHWVCLTPAAQSHLGPHTLSRIPNAAIFVSRVPCFCITWLWLADLLGPGIP